ncbi:MAG TPA: hypothetical protein VHF69_04965, partial [Candidatus Synoicihabitans sp.]|nr:hypothetical protein [Candidatus Synoicihabitans sp.]
RLPVRPRGTAPWSELSYTLLVLVAGLASPALEAADKKSSIREGIAERLRSEFRYQPKSTAPTGNPSADPEVVQMQPFVVLGEKDYFVPVARIIAAQRQLELEQRPSLERGASVEKSLGGRPATIGPRPYRDLLADDAKFKTSKAITPTWNLLDLKL